jgi:signal transduction histidine kinase
VRGDLDLLKQALLNVVVNGIEAMREGGRLDLELRREEDEYVVSVADQGPGIPPELEDKIFNLYFTTKAEGTGIGLAVTFRVIHLHGAAIDFSTELGKGTVFRMRFPVLDEPGRPEAGQADGERRSVAAEIG